MNLLQSIKMAWKSIAGAKIRSFLTMLGIIIGVSSVITLVSVGQGTTSQITDQLEGLGTDLLTVNIMGRGSATSLSFEEAMALGDLEGVKAVSPVISGSVTAKKGTTNDTLSIEGIAPSYEEVQDFHVQAGRYIIDMDNEFRMKVALIGTEAASTYFGTDNPVGQTIQLNGSSFTIVGLLESKGSSLTASNDNKLLIPIATAERFLQSRGVRSITVQVQDTKEIETVKTSLEAALDKKFLNADNAYSIFNSQEMLDTLNSTTQMLSLALGGIAGISLLVGGIGIMNIMLVSVSERTREIGVRKAIGAKKRDILMQFMVESTALSGFGGLIGIGLGYGASALIGRYSSLTTTVSIPIVLIAFGFSLFIGVVFGMIPANKAAKLRPIYALRTD
ncbi:ABC transporter permease [Paenibacillus timonensis]|jgi:putative ABC transport system permease protein|uniref:ABC transporter permease n=1 Tax=Paenibacillus timonensis TaxID=225915 RepID=A0ABW3SCX4_9BACL|nr:ABC transporter permease [Paenibacillus timonensis]MCH1641115.1 ABC transporter permease [Paenibacillus timonensis]GJM82283.1 ABC transporter permease [Paenibacillus sp. HMSSN-139]